jgi:hypothetical protein
VTGKAAPVPLNVTVACAKALPFIVLPVFIVMDVPANMVPLKTAAVPKTALAATCQKMLLAFAPTRAENRGAQGQ